MWLDRAYKPRTACREYADGLEETAHVVTAFTSEDIVDADSTVLVVATAPEARTAFSRLDSPALRRCYQRDVALRQDGINVRLQSDAVIVRRERAVLIANFSTANTGFETALMIGLLKAASGRLAPS
jgi:hypothetical protein